jgi:hypothetical protein
MWKKGTHKMTDNLNADNSNTENSNVENLNMDLNGLTQLELLQLVIDVSNVYRSRVGDDVEAFPALALNVVRTTGDDSYEVERVLVASGDCMIVAISNLIEAYPLEMRAEAGAYATAMAMERASNEGVDMDGGAA